MDIDSCRCHILHISRLPGVQCTFLIHYTYELCQQVILYCTRTHTHAHIYTHTYMYTRTHTQVHIHIGLRMNYVSVVFPDIYVCASCTQYTHNRIITFYYNNSRAIVILAKLCIISRIHFIYLPTRLRKRIIYTRIYIIIIKKHTHNYMHIHSTIQSNIRLIQKMPSVTAASGLH